MPSARCRPVPLSPICAPVTSGSPSRKPVVEAAPPVHWATFSYTLQPSYGPGPKPLIEATIIFGLMAWIFSQGKPMRSSTPGPKFSTSTSQVLISAVRTSLPFGFLVSSVIERLLWLSMVKYRLSTLGMSCNWPRVMSPTPGRSTLITSAPNQASNCVQVGPAIDAVIVEDHDADRQLVAADRLDLHAGEAERTVAFHRERRFAGLDGGGDAIAHADSHHAPGADVDALARLVHVDDAAGEVERVGAFDDQDGVRVGLDDVAHHGERAVEVHRRRILGQGLRQLRDVLVLAFGDRA